MIPRDKVIDTICSNLFQAGLLSREEYVRCMLGLHQEYDSVELAALLARSERMLDMSLEMTVLRNQN